MRIKTETSFQTFNDGICRIFAVENAGGRGSMPVPLLREKERRVPYEKRTVGLKRYYEAKRENAKVELLIRIPDAFGVSTMDVCVIGDARYGIQQIQEVRDVMPGAKDLTLKSMEEGHGFAGV